VTPFEVKPTVPVGEEPPFTVAVSVTCCPEVEGFALEATVVVVGAWLLLFTICVNIPLLPALLLSPE
jgi:hypothetical protein